MTTKLTLSTVALLLLLTACGDMAGKKTPPYPKPNANATVPPTPTVNPTPQPTPKNGDYPGKGKVTKINNELGSVELNHEKIEGVMEPMIMEFYVSDKALLKGLAVGDNTEFTLRYKDATEIITAIKKVK